jgi:hypothetical protein
MTANWIHKNNCGPAGQLSKFLERTLNPLSINTRAVSVMLHRIFRINIWAFCLALFLAGSQACFASEPEWVGVIGRQPLCPKHAGSRTYRSETIQKGNTIAFIECTSYRDNEGCHYNAEINIDRSGSRKSVQIPNPGEFQQYLIVDFSPDASQLLVQAGSQVGALLLPNGGINWQKKEDLFHWENCIANTQPLGFTADGKIVIQAGPSMWVSTKRPPDCVDNRGLYEADLAAQKVTRLPDSKKIEHYGKIKQLPFQDCKSDPDIAAECFNVHGRLSVYNGAGVRRIWWIGTKHMLYIPDEFAMPESLASTLTMGVDIYGDFLVCPLEKQKAGHMQRVCVEKAQRLVIDQ